MRCPVSAPERGSPTAGRPILTVGSTWTTARPAEEDEAPSSEEAHVKTRVFIVAAALALAAPAAAQGATVPIQQLSGDFAATNNSVTKTPEGVHFGVYFDGAVTGGSLLYSGADGQPFSSLTALGYTYNYTTSADLDPLGAPYLRVLLDDTGDGVADHDVIFDATICGTVAPTEDEDHAVDVTTQLVRVDDDPGADCANTQTTFAGAQARQACRGAVLRRIHAPTRSGERFLRVNAALQTASGLRALRSQGRTVTVDLRNRPEANYNVRLISRYRTRGGHTRRVVTRRNLSVACS